MANILTHVVAANALRTSVDDTEMLDLLPMVDRYITGATGRDWSADAVVYPEAKSAARLLLVMWFEDPGMRGSVGGLHFGLQAALAQLEALALRYKTFEGRVGAGLISLAGARKGDTVTAVTGIVGASGSQAAAFETVISVEDEIQQVSVSDLSGKWYRALLTPVEAK